ncbi:MAG: malonyl-CoA synthase [Pseudomonadota bacterium]
MSNHLFDGLLSQCEPGHIFAHLQDGRRYTYQDVHDVSGRFANLLLARGLTPGDRVAVQIPKSIEALMLYLGTIRAGGVFLPLNTGYTATEIRYFVENAEPTIFVCDPKRQGEYEPLARELGFQLETLGVWVPQDMSAGSITDAGHDFPTACETVPRGADDLAAILYTSGTTGRSKGAMLTHENLLSNARDLIECWQFTAEDVLIHALPIFHTHGLFVATNVTLAAGGSMIFMAGFDSDAVMEALPRATSMMGVPTFYTRLLDHPRLSKATTKHMRLFVSGSAPLLAETHIAFEERTGHRILERYGMTETNMNTSNPYEGERLAGTVGFPLPNVSLRIADPENGAELPQGQIGVIEVRGPNVFAGYWRMPEKTAEEFRADGFFITGDLGRIDDEGYVHIVGRAKDLIISGGYNVYPKEIELVLDDQPGVQESAVIGVPHPDFGEGVIGIVVAKDGARLEEAQLKDAMSGALAKFKQPKRIYVRDSLPRNAMGKVQKNLLRLDYADTFKLTVSS